VSLPPELEEFAEREGLSDEARDTLTGLWDSSSARRQPGDGVAGHEEPEQIWTRPTLDSGDAPVPTSGSPTARTDAYGPTVSLDERYEDLGLIAIGGMGEVRRVRDRTLGRVMAMKIIKKRLIDEPMAVARFIEEAQATAQLQHPGIVPVHEIGRLDDGRHYFTMKEVRGQTLSDVIVEVHAASRSGDWRRAESGWSLRRLVAALRSVCEAVAYAHHRGVVHRDLKPSNIMVGAFGEVLVVDWGVAKVLQNPERWGVDTAAFLQSEASGTDHSNTAVDADTLLASHGCDQPTPPPRDELHDESMDTEENPVPFATPHSGENPVVTARSREEELRTRAGNITGTPAYMAPEQALGEVEEIGPPADVYALGTILHEILTGRPPYTGNSPTQVLMNMLRGGPPTLDPNTLDKPIPEELRDACLRAMERDFEERFPDAAALAEAIESWLDGARRREKALEIVADAERRRPHMAALREEAARLRREADTLNEAIDPYASAERYHEVWALRDEADALDLQAELERIEYTETLRAALIEDASLQTARARLADFYRARHSEAERADDSRGAARWEALLRSYNDGRHGQPTPRLPSTVTSRSIGGSSKYMSRRVGPHSSTCRSIWAATWYT